MRLVAKKENSEQERNLINAVLKIDPRVLDIANWTRLKLVVASELCDPAWGCKLYELERRGKISLRAKRAGDKYHQMYLDWRKWMAIDPEEFEPVRREFLYGKIKWVKDKLNAYEQVIGKLRLHYVNEIVIYENWPWTERQLIDACDALEDLANYVEKGKKYRTNRQRKTLKV